MQRDPPYHYPPPKGHLRHPAAILSWNLKRAVTSLAVSNTFATSLKASLLSPLSLAEVVEQWCRSSNGPHIYSREKKLHRYDKYHVCYWFCWLIWPLLLQWLPMSLIVTVLSVLNKFNWNTGPQILENLSVVIGDQSLQPVGSMGKSFETYRVAVRWACRELADFCW